ncbi:MarR family winged helix-turn-helix transcriptional regulator [Arthrobacter sp. KN11-1C]|uniref:MarR family winged helix-turn-helix transcriptional regulator n=1 Tax=Arthrobacter sp. KN11-1C TaxID=3445774 RepID=UPI003F9F202A
MSYISNQGPASPRLRRRAVSELKAELRGTRVQLSVLNHQVGTQAELKDVDLDCLDLISSRGPLSPSMLAKLAGLHPATMTGILDRLERGGWIARDRDPSDRRAVVIRALPDRNAEMFRLYSGMNSLMDTICADYDDAEIAVITDFLRRVQAAGRTASEELGN